MFVYLRLATLLLAMLWMPGASAHPPNSKLNQLGRFETATGPQSITGADRPEAPLAIHHRVPRTRRSGRRVVTSAAGNRAEASATSSGQVQLFYVGSTMWKGMNDIVVDGPYAYCAENFGFTVVDVSDPPNSFLLTHVYFPRGRGVGVTVSGTLVVLADGQDGVKILDVSDPSRPIIKAEMPTPSWVGQADLSGSHLYWVDRDSGLYVADISNPGSPQMIGSLNVIGGNVNDVVVCDSTAYVVNNDGLWVIDVSDPAAPSLQGMYTTPGTAASIVCRDEYAYVGDRSSLQVIDVSNPSLPQFAGAADTGVGVGHITLVNNYVYSSGLGLQIIDVTDPTSPQLISTSLTHDHRYFRGLSVTDTLAYLITGGFWDDGIHIQNVSDPVSTFWVGSYDSPGRPPLHLGVSADYAVILSFPWGIHSFDVSDPFTPQWTGSVYNIGTILYAWYWRVATNGNLAYVASRAGGGGFSPLEVYDLSVAPEPAQIGSYGAGKAAFVLLRNNLVYLSLDGLQILDVSNPAVPQLIGSDSTSVGEMVVEGDYLYSAVGSAGLRIFDVGDSTAPTLLGTILPNTSREVKDLAVKNGVVYLVGKSTGNSGRMFSVDVSDPAFPVDVSFLELYPGDAVDIAILGSHAYVPGTSKGVRIIDITNPAAMFVVDTILLPIGGQYPSQFVATLNNLLYVADPLSGVLIFSTTTSRGDPNDDGIVTSADIIYMVNHVFKGGPGPIPDESAGDVNCDGIVTSSDIIFMVNYIFKSGPPAACA